VAPDFSARARFERLGGIGSGARPSSIVVVIVARTSQSPTFLGRLIPSLFPRERGFRPHPSAVRKRGFESAVLADATSALLGASLQAVASALR
jgi:hypothetical protein